MCLVQYMGFVKFTPHTVDERNPAPVEVGSWLVVCPIIFKVLYIPSGAGFLPSTASTTIFNRLVCEFHHIF